MNKRTALIGLLFLVILALLLRRQRQITILQPTEIELTPPPLNRVDIRLPEFQLPEFPEFRNPYIIPGNSNNFDWMNTTSITCNCNARTVQQINPIITSTKTIIKFVSNPPPVFNMPVFSAPQFAPPVMVRAFNVRIYGDGRRVTSRIIQMTEQEFRDKEAQNHNNKVAYEFRLDHYRWIRRLDLAASDSYLQWYRAR